MKCRWELIGFLAPFLENFIKILFCRKVKLFTLTKCKGKIMIFCLQPSAMLSAAAINLHVCLYCYLNHSKQATSKKNSNNSKSLTSLATKFSKKLSSFYTMTMLHQEHAHLERAYNNSVKPRLTASSVIQSPCYSTTFLDAWQNGHTFSCKRNPCQYGQIFLSPC